ncbi:transcriptional regulator SplA domain-containing protein [Alteribacillus sp. HJP-4]|uniref:transcriptional regulator SplA domain-containing protein n=1 Tax=Alteribacillus sp. HJP-4 TaxID=2775394 RepID=UPI0035CCE345
MLHLSEISVGDKVYVMFRNPHSPDVANVHETIVSESAETGNFFLTADGETYPLDESFALFSSPEQAEAAYEYYFSVDN